MARQITLTWQADGAIDSYSVYRDTATIDTNNLPTPIATGITDKTYVDNAVDDDVVYYYVIASVAGENVEYSEVISTDEASKDPYWNNVASLLRFDGGITDLKGKVWEKVGTADVTNSNSRFGSGSLSKVASTGGLRSGSIFSSDDFCIECWIYIVGNTNDIFQIFNQRQSGTALLNPRFEFRVSDGNITIYNNVRWITAYGTINISADEWVHVAYTYESGVHRCFVNGVKDIEMTEKTTFQNRGQISLGYYNYGDLSERAKDGYIDEFRITMGVPRYTENFTPPTAPFPDA